VSVADKTGITDFVAGLVELGIEIYAPEGTKRILQNADYPVKGLDELPGFTGSNDQSADVLQPAVFSGIAARRDNLEDRQRMEAQGYHFIDIVVANLGVSPDFPATGAITYGCSLENLGLESLEEALQSVDIGDAALVRAAAKSFSQVVVVVDPVDYDHVLDELRNGEVSTVTRRRLATKAFQHTAAYDAGVCNAIRAESEIFPSTLTVTLHKVQDFRYGENPHQPAALYADSPGLTGSLIAAKQIHGKEPSYVNLFDLDVALASVKEFASTAVAIVKHGSPCGLACGETLLDAYRAAAAGDPVAAVGAAIAFNREVDIETARDIALTFYEDLVAPGFSVEALDVLRKSKRDFRIFEVSLRSSCGGRLSGMLDYKRISGGFLVQCPDSLVEDGLSLRVVTEREPTLEEFTTLVFAQRAVKHVKSNGTVLAKRLALVGVGAGQMDRLDSVQIALQKAGSRVAGSVMASDGFFVKPDAIECAAAAGVTALIQPRGSHREDEIIRFANRRRMAMIVTELRHFRH
jgi:phosphoribosylaminoimidazolecarboxamide formyltransferase/IMP cyclohydrolase